jgi:murein DD-endopeptidase MepM/ murein hydrolase activator NlpD
MVADGSPAPDRGAMRRLLLLTLTLLTLSLTSVAGRAHAGLDPVGSWPLQPRPEVVEGFDPPSSTWGAGHRGVDLAGSIGQPVHAALGGRISFAGTIAGKAVVVVDHGPTRTTYEPVTAALTVGDRVAEGDPIGTLVLPGSHCFPAACLHWGWIEGETYLDPLRLVGAGPVRLVPLAGLAAASSPLPTPYADWRPLLRLLQPGVQP